MTSMIGKTVCVFALGAMIAAGVQASGYLGPSTWSPRKTARPSSCSTPTPSRSPWSTWPAARSPERSPCPAEPTGLVLSPDGSHALRHLRRARRARVCVVDVGVGQGDGIDPGRPHAPSGPAISPDGKTALRLQPVRQRRFGDRPGGQEGDRPGAGRSASRSPRPSRPTARRCS